MNNHWDKLPEILQTKITLMAYKLEPHPTAKIITDMFKFGNYIEKLIYTKYEKYQEIADEPTHDQYLVSFMNNDLINEVYYMINVDNGNRQNDMKCYTKKVYGTAFFNIATFIIHFTTLITEENEWEFD